MTQVDRLSSVPKRIGRAGRRRAGAYYTPSWITSYITEQALQNYLSHYLENHFGENDWIGWLHRLQEDRVSESHIVGKLFFDVLIHLKVCDIACGTGEFLFAMASQLQILYESCLRVLLKDSTVSEKLENLGLSTDSLALNKHILTENLFGVDIRPTVVERTRKRLLWKMINENPDDPILETWIEKNIICADTLIDSLFEHNSREFDIIIGNPPYFRLSSLSKDYKQYLTERYKHVRWESNAFALFIERGYELLNIGGVLSFVVHKNMFNIKSYESLRRWLLSDTKILNLVDLGKDVFSSAAAETAIISIEKTSPQDEHMISLNLGDRTVEQIDVIGDITQGTFHSEVTQWSHRFPVRMTEGVREKLRRIRDGSRPLGYLCTIKRGIETGNNSRYVSRVLGDGDSWRPLIRGCDIERYHVKRHAFIDYRPEELKSARNPDLICCEKLITPQNGTAPKFVYDPGLYYVLNSATYLTPRDGVDVDLKVLLLILNSSLLQWVFQLVFTNFSSITVNIMKNNLTILPVKYPENIGPWRNLADMMLSLAGRSREIKSREQFNVLDKRVSKMVEELYLSQN